MCHDIKKTLTELWFSGIHTVNGKTRVTNTLTQDNITHIDYLLAIGKAASSMTQGALPKFTSQTKALLVTKYQHVDDIVDQHSQIEVLESAHPIPDDNSLNAGKRVKQFVDTIPPNKNLLLLLSGGASALVEQLPKEVSLAQLQQLNETLIASGASIEQINAIRIQISQIKGGKLLANFNGSSITVYAISDVADDDIEIIGSGIGAIAPCKTVAIKTHAAIKNLLNALPETDTRKSSENISRIQYRHKIIASNQIAQTAIADTAVKMNFNLLSDDTDINRDYQLVADSIADRLIKTSQCNQKGIYIWGGEPTITLPTNPGLGGRNQSLALAIAKNISGQKNIAVIVAGSDGSDGPTDAAGAIVDGKTFNQGVNATQALTEANAYPYLKNIGVLFSPGVTGTNVRDLIIAIIY